MKSLFVSFSGGKTSAFMAWWVKTNIDWLAAYSAGGVYKKVHYVFANTGQEHEKTLEFVQRCDDEWQLGITWVEAVVNPEKGKGIRHRVVDFNTASRNGEPFEAQIAKEGIPNKANPKCSDRLKLRPMESYRRSLGYKNGDYDVAIGIRCDEIDRIHPRHKELNIIYPLVSDVRMTRPMIDRWWSERSFNLEIPAHYGNCVWCWQKSLRKLLTIMQDDPSVFNFPARMEREYGSICGVGKTFDDPNERRTFFRDNLSTINLRQLLRDSGRYFDPWVDTSDGVYTPDMFNDPYMDSAGGCSESCDIYTGVA